MSRSTSTHPSNRDRFSRRRFLRAAAGAFEAAGAASLGGALFPVLAGAQQAAGPDASAPAASAAAAAPAIATTDLGGLKMLEGAGCNVLAMHGEEGALMVDGGLAANADALLRAVYAATGNERVRLLIDTHWHPEQTGANEAVGRAGGTILAHEKTRMYLSHTVYAMAGKDRLVPVPPLSAAARPNKSVRGDGTLKFAGRRVDYGYLPAAHTDGDLYVHFPELKVLAAGGVVSGERWPLLEYRNGAWLGGRVRALEWLADLVEPDTRVVPAEGRLLTGRDMARQRDIYEALFKTMIGYMNMGFGPEDAVARKPLERYEAEFGDASDFIYGAYRSMLIAYVPD